MQKKSPSTTTILCFVARESFLSETVPRWVNDSRETSLICHDENTFVELREVASLNIKMRDDLDVHAKDKGVNCSNNNVSGFLQSRKLDDVLYVSGLDNLLSVVRMFKSGGKVSSEGSYYTFVISLNDKCIAESSLHGKYFYFNIAPSPLKQNTAFVADFGL